MTVAKNAGSVRGTGPRLFWAILLGCVIAGFCLRFATALRWPTLERPDEIYQNLEPAYRLWTGRGVITWEWRDGIRSWLFPGALSTVMMATHMLHLPASAAVPAVWAVLSLLSCGTVAAGVALGWRQAGLAGAALCGVLTAAWPDMVYFGPKTLGEVQAGNLLVIAAALASVSPGARGRWRLLATGLLLGLVFDIRFQLAVPALLVAWWPARGDLRRWALLALGAAVPLLALGVLDWMMLGSPFQSVWKNIQVNLLQDKAAAYGVSPIWAYGGMLLARNGAAAVAMVPLFMIGARRLKLLALLAVTVIGFHSLIRHKELSFVYAALPAAMIVVGVGLATLLAALQSRMIDPPPPRKALRLAALTALIVAVSVGASVHPFREVHPVDDYAVLWSRARTQPDLCGLALYSDSPTTWSVTGGYVMLGRDVPIMLATDEPSFAEVRDAANDVIAPRQWERSLPGYAPLSCHGASCLFHRPDRCNAAPAHEISAELARTQQ